MMILFMKFKKTVYVYNLDADGRINRDAISGYVRKATDKIHVGILIKFETKIDNLYMQNRIVDFKSTFSNALDYIVLLNKIEISINDLDSNYTVCEWGSGTKSLAIIAIHRTNALLKSIVLGIEEFEINLHP
jgi:hypothetical protein